MILLRDSLISTKDSALDEYSDWYTFLTLSDSATGNPRNRFCDGLARLGGESDTIKVIKTYIGIESIFMLIIHESDESAVQKATQLLKDGIDNTWTLWMTLRNQG